MAPIVELLDAAQIQLDEASDTLSRYQSALDLDPERLAEVEAQIGKLHELSRKHRVPMSELARARDDAARRARSAARRRREPRDAAREQQARCAREYATAAQRADRAHARAAAQARRMRSPR